MSDALPLFLSLAEKLSSREVLEIDLPEHLSAMPKLDENTFNSLAMEAQTAWRTLPRRGWAIAAVADLAAQQTPSLHMQAQAAFYLAWAANEWVQPVRVAEAAMRAQTVFETLHESGWVAASVWQKYALPWTHNNYAEAAQHLATALAGLQEWEMEAWVPHCQLSLAYAHLLRGEFEPAQKYLQASEIAFSAREDIFHLARTCLFDASRLRRQGHLDETFTRIQQALAVFQTLGASAELGKTYFQLGHLCNQRGEYLVAEAHFQKALEYFDVSEVLLWIGQCNGGLAQVHNNMGRSHEALQKLEEAGKIYDCFDVLGLRADNLLDQARQHMLQAEHTLSLNLLRHAEVAYEKLHASRMSALAALYQGEACLHLTRYQQALHHLERAYTRFHLLDEPARQAESMLYLAQGWFALGHLETAREHLEDAITRFRQTSQFAFLAQALNQLGLGLLNHGLAAKALPILDEAYAIAQTYHIELHAISAQLHKGECLAKMDRNKEAVQQLENALQVAKDKALTSSQLECLLALGEIYKDGGASPKAKETWREALSLSQEAPGLVWQAHAGLGSLAVKTNDFQTALEHYRAASAALQVLRQDFWQPHLAGLYIQQKVGVFLDQAVQFAAMNEMAEDLLTFMETGKAQTLVHQLATSQQVHTRPLSDELDKLKSDISQIQEMLRAVSTEPVLIQRMQYKALYQQLRMKKQAYHDLQSRLERQNYSGENPQQTFSLSSVRTSLGVSVGEHWVVLNYYLTEDMLVGVLLTPNQCESWHAPIDFQTRQALTIMSHAQGKANDFSKNDLGILSQLFFPETLSALLHPNTTLIISPHQALNKIPWAILPLPGAETTPLVSLCVPLCVPSLQVLEQLVSRPRSTTISKYGLAVALSTFQQQHAALPYVLEEVETLCEEVGDTVHVLTNTEATWEKLLTFAQTIPLNTKAFLHLATHAFHDPQTGRLAGLALFDQDVWLDQLWELAPLPPLITLSACYGLQSRIYEGDEQLSLVTTCLAAQANHIVGSLWAVLDQSSAPLMEAFYRFYMQGVGVAQALAFAQREQWRNGGTGWEGFLCVGLP